MTGKGLWNGLKSYAGALLTVLLFPLFWSRSLRLARRHREVDASGVAKVAVAILLSIVILAGGAFALLSFQSKAEHTMYTKSLDRRVSVAVGETVYQENVAATAAADVALPIIEANLANATLKLEKARAINRSSPSEESKKAVDDNATDVAKLQQALTDTRDARTKASANVGLYGPNHALYGRLVPAIRDEDDASIRSMMDADPLEKPAEMDAHVDDALALKDRAVADMHRSMWLFVWPSLFGAFLAPVVLAVGSILAKAFVPSDTVGYKPYPGMAAGLFLLFGAFGVPSIPFAAWTYLDFETRSREGQISL
ncbi:MAG TPA: hypothetical protein VM327_01725 [Candidatus Thermoplasmatota archaeon]|nr:hypothetical protein [Candidatus Thermoplasmatota archaeon]